MVNKDGKVIGFYSGWYGGRKFPMDMAEFAINVKFYKDSVIKRGKKILFPFHLGQQETHFLEQFNITANDLEPLAERCTRVILNAIIFFLPPI